MKEWYKLFTVESIFDKNLIQAAAIKKSGPRPDLHNV